MFWRCCIEITRRPCSDTASRHSVRGYGRISRRASILMMRVVVPTPYPSRGSGGPGGNGCATSDVFEVFAPEDLLFRDDPTILRARRLRSWRASTRVRAWFARAASKAGMTRWSRRRTLPEGDGATSRATAIRWWSWSMGVWPRAASGAPTSRSDGVRAIRPAAWLHRMHRHGHVALVGLWYESRCTICLTECQIYRTVGHD